MKDKSIKVLVMIFTLFLFLNIYIVSIRDKKYNDVEIITTTEIITTREESTTYVEIKQEETETTTNIIEECDYILYEAPNNYFKSYMDYRTITDTTSNQWQLQQYAYNGNYGIRMINNRYCIAMGNGFNVSIGDYVDLVLTNDNIISCIIAEIKDNKDTDSSNKITLDNGCISEFIVNDNYIPFKNTGNVSTTCEEWNCSIKEVKVYNKNYLKEIK